MRVVGLICGFGGVGVGWVLIVGDEKGGLREGGEVWVGFVFGWVCFDESLWWDIYEGYC